MAAPVSSTEFCSKEILELKQLPFSEIQVTRREDFALEYNILDLVYNIYD